MDIFAQNKLLIRFIVLLAILNIGLMFAFVWTNQKNKAQVPKPLAHILQKELNLNPEQVNQIEALRENFFAKEKILAAQIRAERDSMNMLMFNKDTDESLVTSLARKVAENEYQMEILRLEQAKALKAICTPAQLEKFEGLMKEIKDYFKPAPPQK